MRIVVRLAVVAALVYLAGCVPTNAIHYTVELAEPISAAECARPAPTAIPEQLVGVALSGGGSRASVFSAAVMEALWEHGYLDLVTHISSVSGGSFASAYFAANMPRCAALDSDVLQTDCWLAFFAEFKLAMRSHFFKAMAGRQTMNFRFASNTRMAFSLQETIDAQFLHGVTFGELAARNASLINDGLYPPVLLINATSYDNGRRVVLSNSCFSEQPPASTSLTGSSPLDDPALRGHGIAPPGCDQPVPPDMPLSLAVTTSAAFPGIVGPITLEVPATCDGEGLVYWHLADGGMADNTGIDTIEEVVLRRLRAEPRVLQRALIFSVFSTLSEEEDDLRQIENFWPAQHPEQAVLAYTGRSQGYHRLFWERYREDLAADGIAVENIEFAIMAADLDRWPASCTQAARAFEKDPEQVRAEIAAAVATIPTRYNISECNADLLEMAARDVVSSTLDATTRARLRAAGFEPRKSVLANQAASAQ